MRTTIFSLLSFVLLCGCHTGPRRESRVEKPVAPRQKQIFLVIDDAGLAMRETQRFLDIPVPMTIAVLPHLKETREVCAAIARDARKEIILHQPMEAYNPGENPGIGAIHSTTSPGDIPYILGSNLSSVRGAVGMNNHMGSRITENPVLMREVLRYCKANGLFFLDSKTAFNSVVARVARTEQMHFEDRDTFLDIQHDREYVRGMWSQAVAKARDDGYAIIIGHAWSEETAAAVRDSYETLQRQGYTFHKLSELYE